jgi:uncharacterized protein (TIGR03435 family)
MNRKKLLPWIIAFAALPGSALWAQSLTGTWQGALQIPDRELRTVFKISTTDAEALKAVLYSIDQGGQPISANTVTRDGASVKISILGIGGTYEGKLSADGNSIAGTWTQGGAPLTLTLKRATPETAWTIPEPPKPPKPMAADANPSFEVATIKPSKPDTPGRLFRIQPGHFSTINTTLTSLIGFCYGLHPRQIVGAPAWVETQKYDLDGRPDGEGQPSVEQWKTMMQKLLADRFQLSFHHDKKELPVYALVVAKTGSKVTKSDGDPNGAPSLLFRGLGILPVHNATMADFAGVMQSAVLDRPVVDQTGLTGRYDFVLTWTPDETQFASLGGAPPAPTDKPDAPPDLFTAIQQQAGLKFESTKAAVDVMVIDKVEKPSEN